MNEKNLDMNSAAEVIDAQLSGVDVAAIGSLASLAVAVVDQDAQVPPHPRAVFRLGHKEDGNA